MHGLDQTAQRMTEFTSSVMSLFIFLAMVGAVFAIFSTIRAYNRGEADESQKQRSIIVGILIITLSIVVKIILVGIDDSSSSSSSSNGFFSKWSLDFNYEEFKKYLSAYWGYGKVVIIFITLYYVARLIYLYRLSKDTCKMFKSYVSIINKHFIKGKPIEDHRVKAFVVDNDMVNPLEPELWNKNAAKYFNERIQ
jgi:hypothetical protein